MAETANEERRMVEAFQNLMTSSTQQRVSPESCIPLACIRDVTDHGVRRLMKSYREGPAALSAQPLVVGLSGERLDILRSYLSKTQNLRAEDETDAAVLKFEKWYGVIDGMHRLTALQRLMTTDAAFKGFLVGVRVVADDITDREIVQAARANNDLTAAEHKVEGTTYDQIKGYYEEFKRIQSGTGTSPTPQAVAEAYTGMVLHSKSVYVQRARIAMSLSQESIGAIGEVVNAVRKGRHGSQNPATSVTEEDPRLFRKTISFNLLKGAGKKLGSLPPSAQAAAMRRVLSFCEQHGRTALSSLDFVSLIEGAKNAVAEKEKFEGMLGGVGSEWPIGMEYLKEQLLTTHALDAACASNKCNNRQLLPQIRSKYLAVCPIVGPRLAVFESGAMNADGFAGQGSVGDRGDVDDIGTSDMVNPPIAEPDLDVDLKALGVEVFCSRWQDFRATEQRCASLLGVTDLLLTDLPYNLPPTSRKSAEEWDYIDDEELREVAQFSRKLLRPGGYAVVFCGFRSAAKLIDEFKSAGLRVPSVPCVAVKRQEEVVRRVKSFCVTPFSSCEYFVEATLMPKGAEMMNMGIQERPYEHLGPESSTCSRRLSVIAGVPTLGQKLKENDTATGRKFVRSCEKPLTLLHELLTTYCPKNGLVVDLYAGTYSTGLACLRTGRPCVLVECDTACHKRAITRLRKIAKIVNANRMVPSDAEKVGTLVSEELSSEHESNLSTLAGSEEENGSGAPGGADSGPGAAVMTGNTEQTDSADRSNGDGVESSSNEGQGVVDRRMRMRRSNSFVSGPPHRRNIYRTYEEGGARSDGTQEEARTASPVPSGRRVQSRKPSNRNRSTSSGRWA